MARILKKKSITHYDEKRDNWHGEYDVLFISGAGRQTAEGEKAFEEYVRRLINACERNDWQLGIRLHPKETGDWYADRDWSEYVTNNRPEIHNAILNTEVAVTTGSSVEIESVIMGTPICKCFDQQSPLEEKRDTDLIYHCTPETIETTVKSAMNVTRDDSDKASVLNCEGSVDRIVETVTAS